jgi:hypothetical protein
MIPCAIQRLFSSRHAETCPDCRAHRRIAEALASAKIESTATPPFLHARIMHAVRSENSSRTGQLSLGWKIAPVLALVTAVVFVLLRQSPPAAVEAQRHAWKIASFETPLLPEKAPLETELANLQTDTLNAARALAENFLPSSFAR